jgi:hypothetical protein
MLKPCLTLLLITCRLLATAQQPEKPNLEGNWDYDIEYQCRDGLRNERFATIITKTNNAGTSYIARVDYATIEITDRLGEYSFIIKIGNSTCSFTGRLTLMSNAWQDWLSGSWYEGGYGGSAPYEAGVTRGLCCMGRINLFRNTPAYKKQQDSLLQVWRIKNDTSLNYPPDISKLKNKNFKTIRVADSVITLQFYDNALIDNDTINIFHNGKLIIKNHRLTDLPFEYKLVMDPSVKEHVITMHAVNLGSIPPNTALLKFVANHKTYTIDLSADEKNTGSVTLVKDD